MGSKPVITFVALLACACSAIGQEISFSQTVDKIVASESHVVANLQKYSPVVETYIQNMTPDKELGAVPKSDVYFLGRVRFTTNKLLYRSYMESPRFERRQFDRLMKMYSITYLAKGFAQMMVPDIDDFDQQHYEFHFIRREFLGELKCLVIDVSPRPKTGGGRFHGRIWVEDEGYNIVRVNGTYTTASRFKSYLHFDSWRTNMQPGVWLPTYVYSEETEKPMSLRRKLRFQAQTRIWGYALSNPEPQSEFSSVTVESPAIVDETLAGQDLSPVLARRAWQQQAADNVVDRLETAGLLAPHGEVDKILDTVIANIEITNHLDLQSAIRARVMLTVPLESFTIGRTIVLSRGLLDVLPDEASLAAVLAHEIAHVVLGHTAATRYAFADRMMFPNEKSFQAIRLNQSAANENAADQKALELLQNSPYADKLATAGLFLNAIDRQRKQLPNLLQAHVGNTLTIGDRVRTDALLARSPKFEPANVDQIAALPVGSRIKLDPWTDTVKMTNYPKVPLLSAKEKIPFEITPVYPFLTRLKAVDKPAPSQQSLTTPPHN